MSWPARYPGECGGCEVRIEVGDEVRWEGGVVVHDVCPGTPAEPKGHTGAAVDTRPLAAQGVCPTCRLELPATGVCGECS